MQASRLIGLLGVATMVLLTVALSYDRKNINWRQFCAAFILFVVLAIAMLRTTVGRAVFGALGGVFDGLLRFQEAGARYVLGNLVRGDMPVGVPGPGGVLDVGAGYVARVGAVFAVNLITTLIFLSALISLLYYLGIMDRLLKGVAWVMQKTLRTSGAETMATAASVFLGAGQVPLLIRPYIAGLTSSELVTVMVVGFATAAGALMVVYVGLLEAHIPGIAGDVLAASVLNATAGLMLSKILMPETGTPATSGTLPIASEREANGVIDSAARGALQGMQIGIGIIAIVVAFVALLAMGDAGLGWLGGLVGHPGASVRTILGALLQPLVWVMGVPWTDTSYVGGLIALKVSLVDIVAYTQLATDMGNGIMLDPRTRSICVFALLGFANFMTIGVEMGAIGGLAPERRAEVARYGLRALVVANLAGFMSASLAGLLL